MKLSVKELGMLVKWYEVASNYENLKDPDLKLFYKLEEYLDEVGHQEKTYVYVEQENYSEEESDQTPPLVGSGLSHSRDDDFDIYDVEDNVNY